MIMRADIQESKSRSLIQKKIYEALRTLFYRDKNPILRIGAVNYLSQFLDEIQLKERFQWLYEKETDFSVKYNMEKALAGENLFATENT